MNLLPAQIKMPQQKGEVILRIKLTSVLLPQWKHEYICLRLNLTHEFCSYVFYMFMITK